MDNKEIGRVLTNLRKNAGMTRPEVAAFIGKSDKTVAHWENGYSTVDANMLFTLCKLYDANIDAVFGFDKEHSRQDENARLVNAYYMAPVNVRRAVMMMLEPYAEAIYPEKEEKKIG